MSRALTSLPIVNPTSSSAGLKTRASSGSGTDQFESRRTRIGSPGPATRLGVALKNSSGRLRRVHLIVERRAALRLLLPGHLAPLVGHAGPPNLLPIERCQDADHCNRQRRARAGQPTSNLRLGVVCMQQIAEALMSEGEWSHLDHSGGGPRGVSGSSRVVNLMSRMVLRLLRVVAVRGCGDSLFPR